MATRLTAVLAVGVLAVGGGLWLAHGQSPGGGCPMQGGCAGGGKMAAGGAPACAAAAKKPLCQECVLAKQSGGACAACVAKKAAGKCSACVAAKQTGVACGHCAAKKTLKAAKTALGERDFVLSDQDGQRHRLRDYAGKYIVLEWINWDCPFVRPHVTAGTSRKLVEKYAGKNVVWLGVNSTKYATGEVNKQWHEKGKLNFPVLDDHTGVVGRLFGAKTTPHLVILGPDGSELYNGALDDNPRGRKPETVNYVEQALDAALAGEPISVQKTSPYGCSVKYAPPAALAADFTLATPGGKQVRLSDFRGLYTVLEWTNFQCPFVVAHLKAETTKKLIEKYTDQGVVFLAVNSSHFADADHNREQSAKWGTKHLVLIDQDGAVGRLYDAKTTPHVVVVDPNGVVVYNGAYDNNPLGRKPETVNYVEKALAELLAGKPVSVPTTTPYGCSVKYAK